MGKRHNAHLPIIDFERDRQLSEDENAAIATNAINDMVAYRECVALHDGRLDEGLRKGDIALRNAALSEHVAYRKRPILAALILDKQAGVEAGTHMRQFQEQAFGKSVGSQ